MIDISQLKNKTANNGLTPAGRLSAEEWNTLVEAVEEVQASGTDSHYKEGIIRHTVTESGTQASGYIYSIDNPVTGKIPVSFIDLVTDAGAVFNENSGYFEIGAVTNLSYEEMRRIYADFQPYPAPRYFLRDCASRTVLPFFGDGGGLQYILQGSKIEYIPAIRPNGYPYLYPIYGVTDCYYLRRIDSLFLGNSSGIDTSFKNCPLLETLKIVSLSYSLNLSTCPMVTPESVAFIINYASNANITITLSNRDYDYEADNDVDHALKAHTNVSLNII